MIKLLFFVLFVGISLFLFFLPGMLYFEKGYFKKFFHDKLDWHVPGDIYTSIDLCPYQLSTCKHCGEKIMQDSQGNWFCIEEEE